MVWKNVDRWDKIWNSIEGQRYVEMTDDERRNINAELKVLATDTMNELSAIKRELYRESVPFEEKSQSHPSSCRARRWKSQTSFDVDDLIIVSFGFMKNVYVGQDK